MVRDTIHSSETGRQIGYIENKQAFNLIRRQECMPRNQRCEQFYTDTDARSAQTYSYGALPVISPRPKSARGPSPMSSVGVCLV